MFTRDSRRRFLNTTTSGGVLLGLGDLGFLFELPPVSAAEAMLDPKVVRLQDDIEPLVRFLEETPRKSLLEEVGARIRKGLSYRDLLAALLLAGVRNVQPRPHVGFKFHAVLVVNSAHLASLSSPDAERWLPIFWALDYFKESQAAQASENHWRMEPVNESAIPPARKARQAFIDAMDKWDEPAADAAIAGLARTAGSRELFELFCRYGARDFRDIGHKAIFVANSWRTLGCIGWQNAEPVLRSLAYALLKHDGENPSKGDLAPDRSWRRNVELAAKINPSWQEGKLSTEATTDMLAVLRQGSEEEASAKVVDILNKGVAPQSIWDALLAGSGELITRQPGIVPLHAATTTNALRYAYENSGNDETRKMLLLQNAAFVTLFRKAMGGKLKEVRIDQLEPLPLKEGGEAGIQEIYADVGKNSLAAARKTLAYLKDNPKPKPLIDAARLLIFLKGKNTHDYKFSSAILEDYFHASPAWRDRLLAAGMFLLRGSGDSDNALVQRTRNALKG